MLKKLHIHSNYTKDKKEISKLIENFHSSGELVVKGNRNVLKSNFLGDEKVSLKFFKRPSFLKGFIYGFFRESKAKRSFEYAERLLDGGVLTPFPVAYYEEKTGLGLLANSFYICRHIHYDFTFRELIHNPLFAERELVLRQFTHFTYLMHECKVNFLDHSPGNTLIKKKSDGNYEFYLIDLNRMKFENLSIAQRMDNFKKLWLSKTMVKIISKEYAKLSGESEELCLNLLMQKTQDFKRKITKKKYLKRKLKRK